MAMLEDLMDDAIIKKVGGRFKLSTLMQKRMVALMNGARPLVDLGPSEQIKESPPDRTKPESTERMMKIVIQEILQDKIYLDMEQNVRIRTPEETFGPPELGFDQI